MFQEYQEARKNNADPQEYLNKTINNFTPEQKEQWNNMVGNFMPQNNNIKAE